MQKIGQAKPFVVSAPAGTGKTTLVARLTQEFSWIARQITTTTRTPRSHEVQGRDYHFISREAFQEGITQGEWLEYIELYGNFYGTSRSRLEKTLDEKKDAVLVIDTNGARHIKESDFTNAVYVMILPPSLEILEERLRHRATESPDKIAQRLLWAKEEWKRATEYDYVLINDDLDDAYDVLRSIFIAEDHRKKIRP